MKTLQLTDAEFSILVDALVMRDDMEADMVFDNMDDGEVFYAREGSPVAVDHDRAKRLRDQLDEVIKRRETIAVLKHKMGIK